MTQSPRIGVLGIGNVLMGDDGIGPFVVKVLESRYEFPENVSLQDLGTPGLGITSFFAEYDKIILIDAVKGTGRAGEIKTYRKDQLVKVRIQPRVSPHDPALVEALLFAEVSGNCPEDVLLVGVVPEECELGCKLTPVVAGAVESAVQAVVEELERMGIPVKLRDNPGKPTIWWEDRYSSESLPEVLDHVPGNTR